MPQVHSGLPLPSRVMCSGGLVLALVLGCLTGLSGCGGDQSAEPSRRAPRKPVAPAEVAAPDEEPDEKRPEAEKKKEEAGLDTAGKPMAEGQSAGTSDPFKKLPSEAEAQQASLNNLRTIATAMLAYHDKHQRFPSQAVYGAGDKPLLSWRVELLPLLGQEELYRQFKLDEPWDSPHNRPLVAKMPQVYHTPRGPLEDKTCYLVPVGLGTIFGRRESMSRNLIVDGAENTLLVVEVSSERAVPWTQPEDYRYVPATPTSGLVGLRKGAFLAAFANAAVRAVSVSLGDEFIRALFSTQGREVVDLKILDGKPGETPAVPPGMVGQALDALAKGQQKLGVQYLLAEAVVRATPDVLDSVRWSPALKRPVLAVRWGVFVQGQTPAPRPGTPGAVAAQTALQYWGTAVGEPLMSKFEELFGAGGFGKWMIKAKVGPQVANVRAQAPNQPAGRVTFRDRGQVIHGGLASPNQGRFAILTAAELPAAARTALKDGLDVILVVSIAMKPGKLRDGVLQATSNCTLRVHDVLKDKTIWSSKPAASGDKPDSKIAQAAAEQLLKETTEFLEETMKLTEMPQLTPEVVRSRAEALATPPFPNPLLPLMELRYYEYKKLLKPAEVSAFYAKIAGPDDGPRLATGPEEERLKIVQRWLSE